MISATSQEKMKLELSGYVFARRMDYKWNNTTEGYSNTV